MVETRKRKRCLLHVASSSTSPRTSVILWDLPLHTTDTDVLKTFKKIGKPIVSFISRDNNMTKYTYCCRLKMESENRAKQIMERQYYKTSGFNVRVGDHPEGFKVMRGEHKLLIRDMDFKNGREAFKYIRRLLEN